MHGSLTSIMISLTPIVINRASLSLKKKADFNGGVTRAWSTQHFGSIKFGPRTFATVPETVIGPTEARLDTNDHNEIPLDDLNACDRRRPLDVCA